MGTLSFMFIVNNFFLLLFQFSKAADILTSSQSIADGRTLVSNQGSFELGFFSYGSSRNHYLGIWYKNIPGKTVVWVANRSNPINDTSGLLKIDKTGNLVLVSRSNDVVWWSNLTKGAQNPVVQLQDSGNLVLRDENSEIYLWQSFDYPSDTMLPGMKVGVNLKTGLDRGLTSWKNWDDPSPGDYVWRISVHNNPDPTMWKGSKINFRNGPWNGIQFSGTPQLRPNPLFDYNFVSNEEEVYYIYYPKDKSKILRLVMNQTNNRLERSTWDEASQSWIMYSYLPSDYCDTYGLCGAYGNCISSQSPVCQCFKGFSPKSPEEWNSGVWSQGCARNRPLNCSKNDDGFIKLPGVKLPDTTFSWVDKSTNLDDCRAKCLLNCSCTAYSSFDIRNGGSGCVLWYNDLIDIRETDTSGQDLYIRMSASELGMSLNSLH